MKKCALAAIAALIAGCGRTDQGVAEAKTVAPPLSVVVPDGQEKPTPAENYLLGQGVKIPMAFASGSGLKAIVADNGKERRLMYVTPDGKSLIMGTIYGTDGQNITNQDMTRASITPASEVPVSPTGPQLEGLWANAEGLSWIEEGAGDRVVYVIFDPTCPYCHRLYEATRSVVASKQTRIRWLPVAILADESRGLAAAMYQGSNPANSLTQLMAGSLAPVRIEQASAEKMARNLLLLRDTGFRGVPVIMYRDAAGTVAMHPQVPDDKLFAEIFRQK